ncbi:MAG: septal ring lytic transglycosylase RlpA family protein [Gammaproteobacteria bacterium]
MKTKIARAALPLHVLPLFILPLSVAGCAAFSPQNTLPPKIETAAKVETAVKEEPREEPGGYYLDDGPLDISPEKLAAVPDAVPVAEKINPARSRPYTVFGKTYHPHKTLRPHRERGEASWYGRRYHGRQTASGEVYDMFKMTAAHPVLPIPSYARVTRPDNGKTVVVRINDRGPFLKGRVIDLSYAAAHRIGIAEKGSGEVIVEVIFPDNNPPQNNAPQAAPAEETAPHTYIQLGAFASADNAEKMRRKFSADGFGGITHKVHPRDGLHLFLAGPYSDTAAARKDDNVLCAAGWCGFFTRAP